MARVESTSRTFRLPSFSLRTGLVLFLVLGTGLGMAARWWQDVRERGDAQKWLAGYSKKAKPNAGLPLALFYAPEQGEAWTTAFVRKWVHPEYDRRFSGMHIDGAQLNDEGARRIERVFGVENVVVHSSIPQGVLAHVVKAPGLKRLHLHSGISRGKTALNPKAFSEARTLEWIEYQADSPLSEELTKALISPPNLKSIWLHKVHASNLVEFAAPPLLAEFSVVCNQTSHEVPTGAIKNLEWDASLAKMFAELAKREQFTRLRLFSANLSKPDTLTRFCEASNIRYLHLEGCNVTPDCLREFAKLRKVETLHLHWSPMTHEHLEILATMKTLRGIHALRCDSNDVTNAALAKLEAALPRCKITRYLK